MADLEDQDRLKPGTVLFGYEILKFVGAGHWAYVYKAQHPRLPMSVAIKQLKPSWVNHERSLQRFLREAELVAQIHHPNVVRIFDLEHDKETHHCYIFTEFAEQGTLADLLAKSPGGLPIEEAVRIAVGVCSGLEAVHHQGLVHCDVKPGNILLLNVLAGETVAKLTDFGIAADPSLPPDAGSSGLRVYGSLLYMAPEQLDGEADYRSDLYGLGVSLYELLTGHVPFRGTPHQIMWAHNYLPVTPPRQLRSDIPEQLEAIVMRALRKRPADRYQSATEMRQALEAIAGTQIGWQQKQIFEILLRQGLEALKAGKWPAAIDSLEQAKKLEPGDENVQTGLQVAHAYERQELRQMYEQALECLEKGKLKEAGEALADIIRRDPDFANGSAAEWLNHVKKKLDARRKAKYGVALAGPLVVLFLVSASVISRVWELPWWPIPGQPTQGPAGATTMEPATPSAVSVATSPTDTALPTATPTPTITATIAPASTDTTGPPPASAPTEAPTATVQPDKLSLIVTNPYVRPQEEVYLVAGVRSAFTGTIKYTWKVEAGAILDGQGKEVILYRAPDAPGEYDITVTAEYGGQSLQESAQVEVVAPIPVVIPTEPIAITVDSSPVELKSPAGNTMFSGKGHTIELSWDWYRNLSEDECFLVDARFTGLDANQQCRPGWLYLQWTEGKTWTIDPWLYDIMCPSGDKRVVEWTVYVARKPPSKEVKAEDIVPLSAQPARRIFEWRIAEDGGGETGDDTGGGGRVTWLDW